MKATTRLRELLAKGETVWAPLTYDALTARIVEKVGFDALFISGGSLSVCYTGLPDAGLTTMSEVLAVAQNIVNTVKIPVIVDIDTGWGNAINVRRTIQMFARAGVAAVLLDDQVAPQRCGWIAGKQVISMEEAVGKYRAACDAKNEIDPDFVIVARTDSRGAVGGSFEEAVRRGRAYIAAGADMAFLEALNSVEEVERAGREIPGPKWFNYFSVKGTEWTESRIKELGYTLVVSGSLYQAAGKAVWDFAAAIKRDGPAAMEAMRASMKGHPMESMHVFSGFPEIRRMEDKYLPSEEVARKYAETLGQKF